MKRFQLLAAVSIMSLTSVFSGNLYSEDKYASSQTNVRYPGFLVSGIAFDNEGYLWAADLAMGEGTKRIYRIDVNTGNVVHDIPAPTDWTGGLAFHGENLWAVGKGIQQLDRHTGEETSRIDTAKKLEYGSGLTSVNNWLWYAHGKELKTFSLEGKEPRGLEMPCSHGGLAYDGSVVWLVSALTHTLYQLNPQNGSVLSSSHIPDLNKKTEANDLAWDGSSLWVSLRQGYKNWIVRFDMESLTLPYFTKETSESAKKESSSTHLSSENSSSTLTLVIMTSVTAVFSLSKSDLIVVIEGPVYQEQTIEDVPTATPRTVTFSSIPDGDYVVTAKHGSHEATKKLTVSGDTQCLDFTIF